MVRESVKVPSTLQNFMTISVRSMEVAFLCFVFWVGDFANFFDLKVKVASSMGWPEKSKKNRVQKKNKISAVF